MKQFFTKKFREIALLLSAIMILITQSYVPAQAATKTPAAPIFAINGGDSEYYVGFDWVAPNLKYGYQIYRSTTSSKSGYKLIGTVEPNSMDYKWFTDRFPVVGKTNYYKLRAFVKENGKTVYGKFSAPKSCKLKKLPPIPIQVTYNGKKITLIKDARYDWSLAATIKSVTNTWGKPTVSSDWGHNLKSYTYKKGKTEITIGNDEKSLKVVKSIKVSIGDKNGAMAGVKVGDSKAKAVSTLKKIYGKNSVRASSNKIICTVIEFMPMRIELKDGKVSSITWPT